MPRVQTGGIMKRYLEQYVIEKPAQPARAADQPRPEQFVLD